MIGNDVEKITFAQIFCVLCKHRRRQREHARSNEIRWDIFVYRVRVRSEGGL